MVYLLNDILKQNHGDMITEEIKVYGACGMCDTRIEKTVDALVVVVYIQ
ncbi:MAG: hypothetical protein U9N86_16180 [Bacteroidota bacterium]|nr:hypothetical protein [Bacteroidota bacterium]